MNANPADPRENPEPPQKNNESAPAETEPTMAKNPEMTARPRGRGRRPTSTELVLDLRTWIAAMFATFGAMLAVYGAFFATSDDIAKGAGINLNLWTGVGLIVVAVLFAAWLLMRPTAVDENVGPFDDDGA